MLKETSRCLKDVSGCYEQVSGCIHLPDPETTNKDAAETKIFNSILHHSKDLGKNKSQLDENQYKDKSKGYNLRIDDKNRIQRLIMLTIHIYIYH